MSLKAATARLLNELFGRSESVTRSELSSARLDPDSEPQTVESLAKKLALQAQIEQLSYLRSNIQGWNAWRQTQDGMGMDIDLTGVDLAATDLSGANLSDVDLRQANLSGAILNGCDLVAAYLIGTRLDRADLSGADLRGADLRLANLTKADLRGADLRSTNFQGADLTGADLRGADVSLANLSLVILRDADLRGADFGEADLNGTDFTNARVEQAIFCDNPNLTEYSKSYLQQQGALI